MDYFSTVNPTNNTELQKFKYMSWESAQAAVAAAHQDFLVWRKKTFQERAQVLLELARCLRLRKDELAQQMNLEMGKKIEEGLSEVEKCAAACEYFAQEASTLLAPKLLQSSYQKTEIVFQPMGVIFSIMPWNFPLWQVIRFAAPALMAGNIVILKHADLTAGTADLIGDIFSDLKINLKPLRNCQVDHTVAELIIRHPLIRGVSFTGSTSGGREVAKIAGHNLKKAVLELGGSDAYLILEDADIKVAAKKCAETRLQNCGQSCVAGKRFIVVESVAQEFLSAFIKEMASTKLAPLAAKRFQAQIIAQVEGMKILGGEILLGGVAPEGVGAFYPPTVILFIKNCSEIHFQEIFGPVALVIVVKDTKEAIEIANSSHFGLGGGVFTGDTAKGTVIAAEELEVGFAVVNDFVRSDVRLPFGGLKDSGYGRELGLFGILEFVNIKTVGVNS
jgi:succinate-semialdehyde dehydrogenase/glutarate-semialdehyde dehydrogenase